MTEKFEPLKGKYKKSFDKWEEKYIEEYPAGQKTRWRELTHETSEVLDDVKSAVQGLLKEIEEKCDEWYHIDYYQLPTWGEIKEELKNLIKKWFADVIEE